MTALHAISAVAGMWTFGKHVLLPAGIIKLIDTAEEKVYVAVSRSGVS